MSTSCHSVSPCLLLSTALKTSTLAPCAGGIRALQKERDKVWVGGQRLRKDALGPSMGASALDLPSSCLPGVYSGTLSPLSLPTFPQPLPVTGWGGTVWDCVLGALAQHCGRDHLPWGGEAPEHSLTCHRRIRLLFTSLECNWGSPGRWRGPSCGGSGKCSYP